MTLNRNSAIVKWAYKWEDMVPYQTSLCVIFWRTVLLTPLKFLAIGGSIAMYLSLWIVWTGVTAAATGAVAFIIGTAVLAEYTKDWREERRWRSEQWPHNTKPHVIRDGFRAVKSKVCPIVTIVRS